MSVVRVRFKDLKMKIYIFNALSFEVFKFFNK